MRAPIADPLEELLERLASTSTGRNAAPHVAAVEASDPADRNGNGSPATPPATPPPTPVEHGTLGRLRERFGLSPFECDLLLLLAGIEYDERFLGRLEELAPGTLAEGLTFGEAFRLLPGAHWSALAPGAPLRRSRLIRMGEGPTLARTPIRLEEATLHALLGLPQLDEAVKPWVDWVEPDADALGSEPEIAGRLAGAWQRAVRSSWKLQVIGSDAEHARRILGAFCAGAGQSLYELDPAVFAADASARRSLFVVWCRDAVLHDLTLCFDVDALPDPEIRAIAARELQVLDAPCVLLTHAPLRRGQRVVPRVEIPVPTEAARHAAWWEALGESAAALEPDIRRIVEQFPITAADVRDVASELAAETVPLENRGALLWELSRRRARVALDGLAQLIEPRVEWNDLVMPPRERAQLEELATHVRQRTRVYDEWGFAEKWNRGLGVTALFSGPSGTGKTMAAEVLANELKLDLCRIDLSSTVSKYVGETEKNLRRIFDAAERSGCILVFEEADALFGRRGHQGDGHTRHANIEVGYLLQRMEAYRGLAILTTNLPDALDEAFLRRIRFVIPFRLAAEEERRRIWELVFPQGTPREGLDPVKLARLSVSGAQIRDIALHAAFQAAEHGESVTMRHLHAASHNLMAKLGRPVIEAEVEGWI